MYARVTSFGPEKWPYLCEFFYTDDIHLETQVAPWGSVGQSIVKKM